MVLLVCFRGNLVDLPYQQYHMLCSDNSMTKQKCILDVSTCIEACVIILANGGHKKYFQSENSSFTKRRL